MIPMVASAIEGAAPKSPAKLLGRNTSAEHGEEADNDAADQKPSEKFTHCKMHSNKLSCGSLRFLDHAHGGVDFLAAEKLVFLAFKAVVVHEELFEFAQEFFGQVVKLLEVGILVVHLRHGDQAIIADFLFSVDLLALDDADETGANGDAGKRGLVHKEQNVDGIAVGSEGAWAGIRSRRGSSCQREEPL